jgi:regulator of replication initiation timing
MSSRNKSVRISEEEMNKVLARAEREAEKKDQKKQWIEKMIKSAKTYYKLCPYYDKKTTKCFLLLGEKCTRDGKYETCPTFISFLERKYQEITEKRKMLPLDFQDLAQFA